MGFLKVLGTDLRPRDVRGDREHGDPAALRIEQSVDQMQIAGSAAADADGEMIGECGVGAGRERSSLLVADVFPADVARSANGVGESVEAVAGQAVDSADTAELQR